MSFFSAPSTKFPFFSTSPYVFVIRGEVVFLLVLFFHLIGADKLAVLGSQLVITCLHKAPFTLVIDDPFVDFLKGSA